MLSKPGEWVQNLRNLYDRIPWNLWTWPLKLMVLVVRQIGGTFGNSAWGPILATLALLVLLTLVVIGTGRERNVFVYSALAAPVVVLGAPLVGPTIYQDLQSLGSLLLLVAIIWGIPGLLLGTAVPYLRRPSDSPKTWALVAWAAAAFLIVFTFLIRIKWILVFAPVLLATGWVFWRGAPIEDYWPLIALCIAIVILGVTRITQVANFFNVQALSGALVSEPLARVSPLPEKRLGFLTLQDYSALSRNLYLWNLPNFGAPSFPRALSRADWVAAVSVEKSAAETLESIARRTAARVREQAAGDTALTQSLSRLSPHVMPQIAEAQSATEELSGASRKQLDAISSEAERLTRLSGERPWYGWLGSVFQSPSQPTGGELEVALKAGELSTMLERLSQSKGELTGAIRALDAANADLQSKLVSMKTNLAQQFELCLNGSLGFWISLGLLAGWSRHNRVAAAGP